MTESSLILLSIFFKHIFRTAIIIVGIQMRYLKFSVSHSAYTYKSKRIRCSFKLVALAVLLIFFFLTLRRKFYHILVMFH